MNHPRHKNHELDEINADYELRVKNRERCPLTLATVAYLQAVVQLNRGHKNRETIEELSWKLEDEAGKGFELTHKQALEVLTFVNLKLQE